MPAKIPHDRLGVTPINVTYRLLGSLPQNTLRALAGQRQQKMAQLEADLMNLPADVSVEILRKNTFTIDAEYELAMDDALHNIAAGPFHLQEPEVAKIILDSWLNMQERAQVFVYVICVMGNHVHAVIQAPDSKIMDLGKLMNNHKGYTSRKINEILGRTGLGFWERTYFDRRVRNGKFIRVMWYVLNNPVKAGLVARWKEWPHTYLHPEYRELFLE